VSQRSIFTLQRYGNLFCLKAFVRGITDDPRIVRLLVDTGSSYTALPIQVLNDIGYGLDDARRRVSIMAAGGVLRAPVISVAEFSCLGQQVLGFSVVGLNVPFNPVFNGILGMDFLLKFPSLIDIQKAEIIVRM
jgi:predicted aspartyl protease